MPGELSKRFVGWGLTVFEVVTYVVLGLILNATSSDKTIVGVFSVISFVLVISRLVSSYELKSEFASEVERIRAEVDSQRVAVERVTHGLQNLGESLDIYRSAGMDDVGSISKNYVSITNPRLLEVKDAIVREVASNLAALRYEQQTPILDEPDFYRWLYAAFASADDKSKIRIVSMDADLEWTDTPEENQFWQHNLDAAERGASIERIFFFNADRISKAKANPAIYGHREDSGTKVVGRVVDRDRFTRNSPHAVSEAGEGFIVIDDEFAIVDVFSPDGLARGYVTFKESKVRKYRELYEKFEAVSQPLKFP